MAISSVNMFHTGNFRYTIAIAPAISKEAPARKSLAFTFAPSNGTGPVMIAERPSTLMLAFIRLNSSICLNRARIDCIRNNACPFCHC